MVVPVRALFIGQIDLFENYQYLIYFQTNAPRKVMNPIILSHMGEIVSLLFYKDSFGTE